MAPLHSPCRLLAPGSAALALGLLLAPAPAQNGGDKEGTSKTPPAREANGPGDRSTQDAKGAGRAKGAGGAGDAGGAKDAGSPPKKAKHLSPLRIAVVDLEAATRAHPLFETRIEEHKEWARKQDLELKKLKDTIQSMQDQLKNTIQPGTPAAAKLALEIDTLRFKLNQWMKLLSNEGVARRRTWLLELRAQVNEVIKELAKKQGVHLVLRRRPQRTKADVLYASPALDITEDVIDYLKTKYPRK